MTPTTPDPNNDSGSDRVRLVCPECGSPDLAEEAYGSRRFDVTYYADGSYEDHSGSDWETDSWQNECNGCGASLTYDCLVPEAKSMGG